MLKKQGIPSFSKAGIASSLKKKIAVVFIFICMSINGFIPSSIEISKYSLVMIMATVTQNAVSELFSKYNDSLMFVSNKVSFEIMKLLFAGPFGVCSMQKDMGEREDNAADNEALVIKQAILKDNRKFIKGDAKNSIAGFFVSTVKLFELYHNYKIPDGGSAGVFVLLFLLLIMTVTRKKNTKSP